MFFDQIFFLIISRWWIWWIYIFLSWTSCSLVEYKEESAKIGPIFIFFSLHFYIITAALKKDLFIRFLCHEQARFIRKCFIYFLWITITISYILLLSLVGTIVSYLKTLHSYKINIMIVWIKSFYCLIIFVLLYITEYLKPSQTWFIQLTVFTTSSQLCVKKCVWTSWGIV